MEIIIGKNNSIILSSANTYLDIIVIINIILNEMYADNYAIIIENIIFINTKICSNYVLNKKKLNKIGIEIIHPEKIDKLINEEGALFFYKKFEDIKLLNK